MGHYIEEECSIGEEKNVGEKQPGQVDDYNN